MTGAGPIGELCARAMERLEQDYGPDVVVRDVTLVVEVDEPDLSRVISYSTEDRSHHQITILDEAIRTIERAQAAFEREQED